MAAPSQRGTPFLVLVAGGAELGQLRALSRLRAQLAPTGKLRVGRGRGQEMFADRSGAGGGEEGPWPGRRWPGSGAGVGPPPVGARRGRPDVPRTRSERGEKVAPSKDCVIIGLQIVSAGIRLAEAAQDSGKEIFISPAGLFRASRPSGGLGKVGAGGNRSRVVGILPSFGNGIFSLVIREGRQRLLTFWVHSSYPGASPG